MSIWITFGHIRSCFMFFKKSFLLHHFISSIFYKLNITKSLFLTVLLQIPWHSLLHWVVIFWQALLMPIEWHPTTAAWISTHSPLVAEMAKEIQLILISQGVELVALPLDPCISRCCSLAKTHTHYFGHKNTKQRSTERTQTRTGRTRTPHR